MSKFSYDPNDMIMSEYQCDFCKNRTDEGGCGIYGDIPEDVLKNEIACREFEKKGNKYPWDE